MAEKILLATKREISAKGAKGIMNKLRRDGFVPGVYYSKGKDQINFAVEEIALNKYIFTSKTNIIQLTFEGEEGIGCIIKNVQFDPVTEKIVGDNEAFRLSVPEYRAPWKFPTEYV